MLVLSQIASGIGWFVPRAPWKDASRPFPCLNRPCGCLTYDQCWSGDCCCFTLQEKVSWARANSIIPPKHVDTLIAKNRSQPRKRTCCQTASLNDAVRGDCQNQSGCSQEHTHDLRDEAPIRWVLGMFALKCRGHAFAEFWVTGPALPAADTVTWVYEWLQDDVILLTNLWPVWTIVEPTEPPPR
jgi:hypothetical protein